MTFEQFQSKVLEYLKPEPNEFIFHQSEFNRVGMLSKVGGWVVSSYTQGGFILEFQYDTYETYVDCVGCQTFHSLESALSYIYKVRKISYESI